MLRNALFLFCLFPLAAAAQQALPGLFPFKKDSLWGFADHKGRMVIEPRFASADTFSYTIGRQPYTVLMEKPAARVTLPGGEVLFIGPSGASLLSGFPKMRELHLSYLKHTPWLRATGTPSNILNWEYASCSAIIDKNWTLKTPPLPVVYTDRGLGMPSVSLYPPLPGAYDFSGWGEWPDQPLIYCVAGTGLANVGLRGILSASLDTVIPVVYRDLSNLWNGVAAAAHDSLPGKTLLIGEGGRLFNMLPFEVEFRISENRIAARDALPGSSQLKPYALDTTRRWGFIDGQGKIVVPFRYNQVKGFYQGVALGQREGHHWDVIDTAGRVLMTLTGYENYGTGHGHVRYEVPITPWPGGFVVQEDGKTYREIYGPGLKRKLPYRVKSFLPDPWYHPGPPRCYMAELEGGGAVVFSPKGEVLAHSDQAISRFHLGTKHVYRLLRNGKLLLADSLFTDLTSMRYDSVLEYIGANLLLVKKDGQFGCIDTLLREIVPPRYDYLIIDHDGTYGDILAYKNGRFGAYTLDGAERFPCVFSGNFSSSMQTVSAWIWPGRQGDTWLFCRSTGGCLPIPGRYDSVYAADRSVASLESFFRQRYFITRKGERYGMVDSTGRELFPPEFRQVVVWQNRYAYFESDTAAGLYQLNPWKEVIPFFPGTIWPDANDVFLLTGPNGVGYKGYWTAADGKVHWGERPPARE